MTLVRFSDVGKEFGERWVFRHVSFQVSAGERWGVVGRNGEGKTTLLRVLTGEDEATEGEVWRHPGVRFTLMRQGSMVGEGDRGAATVGEAALEPFRDLLAMEERLGREAAGISAADPESDMGRRLLASYDRHLDEFRRRGGYEMRARAQATLEGLGFPEPMWAQPVRSLSGGERGRLRLVQTLLAGPDVLLLDEPTNHLDLRSTEWLESHLRAYRGTALVVSHDRVFLEHIADHVLHVEEGTAFAYTGDYGAFLAQREERRELQQKEYQKQQGYIARTEEFIRRNLAGQKTKQAKSRRTLLSRMDRVTAVQDEERAMAVRFGGARRSGGTVLKLEGVVGGFTGRPLFEPFGAEVGRGERIAIVGRNGSGKSTLMKIIADVAEPLAGEVVRGTGVRLAHYRQDFSHLHPERSVRQEVSDSAPALGMPELRNHLARFLFTGDEIEARIGDLSGGEQARVALAIATLAGANLLLLDEPTNHLDIVSREALEESLELFDGTVILISHDRAFLSALATRVWALPDAPGRIEDYPGGFDDWLADREQRQAASTDSPVRAVTSPATATPARAAAGLSKNELRRRQAELEQVEVTIAALEEELAAIDAELADPALYASGSDPARARELTASRDAKTAGLEKAYDRWAALGEEIAAGV
ncbi:MAG TPA: ABC-F family ATP-binding cassette domain-containing protein [Longimicrobiaceae bacterium]|nr:ABC-F family ATP-binding cassette domain-containing protein [Longimicrobiaceae bacterium]